MKIGLKIKDLAELKKISTKELAKKINKSRQTIYDIYSGRVSISVELIQQIAIALNVSVLEFFDEDTNEFYNNTERLNDLEAKIQEEKIRIAELEKMIQDKEKIILLLEDKLGAISGIIKEIIEDGTIQEDEKLKRLRIARASGLAVLLKEKLKNMEG